MAARWRAARAKEKEREGQVERLNLAPVLPLLEYLHSLPQDCNDRKVEWHEDEQAREILLGLPDLPDSSQFERWLSGSIDPDYRNCRSLCVWYHIARTVAQLIQNRCL
jgi:hypothetical protein